MNGIPESSINLVHADMFRGNVIINSSKDRIVGIVDWEDALVAYMALDIAAHLAWTLDPRALIGCWMPYPLA